jgi:ferrous iron transport protein A
MLQLSSKKHKPSGLRLRSLSDLTQGQQGVIERLDLAEEDARRMMELGFLPGAVVAAAGSAPGGDPRVYRVDGSEFAIRHETALHLKVRPRNSPLDVI